jgi:hypothetical protein
MSVIGPFIRQVAAERERRGRAAADMMVMRAISTPEEMRWAYRAMCVHHALTLISDHFDLPFQEVTTKFWNRAERTWCSSIARAGWVRLGERIACSCDAPASIPVLPVTFH